MILPNFSFEREFWGLLGREPNKHTVVAGADEVGKGAFAGPVVAAACAFSPNLQIKVRGFGAKSQIKINDSKKLTAKQRERAAFWIRRSAAAYGIGWASVAQINRLGIKKATEIAFRRAVNNMGKKADFLLIDAFCVPRIRGLRRDRQKAIAGGDGKSFSIAAASIVAKVYRDKLMVGLSGRAQFNKYGWDKNKGYGTNRHIQALIKYGTTRYHRRAFVNSFFSSLSR